MVDLLYARNGSLLTGPQVGIDGLPADPKLFGDLGLLPSGRDSFPKLSDSVAIQN